MTGEVNRRNVINPYLEKLQGLLEPSQSAPAKRKAVYLRIFPWRSGSTNFC